jgi:adenine/guanine phosphoribosyltransferase-like PRPP-binding protein
MRVSETNDDPEALALRALVWTLAEPVRATRLLDVTGLTPADLRARAGDPTVLAAALAFLEAHEPDLIACASALGVAPAAIVAAHAGLDAGDAA